MGETVGKREGGLDLDICSGPPVPSYATELYAVTFDL